jgi:peptide-methionine (S)-S-oxide reductase
MIWRFLAVSVAAAVLVGAASGAQDQKDTRSGRNARKGKVSPAAEQPAALGEETAPAGPDSAASGDPFDAAAKRPGTTAGNTGKTGGAAAETGVSRPKLEKATFGAGCFWHVEHDFEFLPGVKSAVSGYSGGSVPNPSYEEVHEGFTGHAEVVQVTYDPSVISYEQLLKVFWSCHDPTQLNRQGPDVGTQYRSIILYHNPEQRQAALKSYRELTAARVFSAPILTQLVPMKAFFRAEEYHQNYYGGKDGPSAGVSRSRRTRKPAAGAKPAAAARPNPPKSKPAAPSASRAGGAEGEE